MAPEEPGDVWRRTGGHKVAPAPDYYDFQVKCCLHCLIVCLAHFDNFHNEQQSERKIQGLMTNQSGSCRRKKQPKTVIFFQVFFITPPSAAHGQNPDSGSKNSEN